MPRASDCTQEHNLLDESFALRYTEWRLLPWKKVVFRLDFAEIKQLFIDVDSIHKVIEPTRLFVDETLAVLQTRSPVICS